MSLMEKAPEIGKKVGETTVSIAKSAASATKEIVEQVIEIGKLKKDILLENARVNKLYEDIGKHAYDIFNSSKEFTLLEPLFLKISDSFARIEEYKEKIEEIKKSSNISDEDIPPEADAPEADAEELVDDKAE